MFVICLQLTDIFIYFVNMFNVFIFIMIYLFMKCNLEKTIIGIKYVLYSIYRIYENWSLTTDTFRLCDKFVNDIRQVGGFLQVLRFPPPIKLKFGKNCCRQQYLCMQVSLCNCQLPNTMKSKKMSTLLEQF